MSDTLTFEFPEKYLERGERFAQVYDLKQHLFDDKFDKRCLKPKAERVCRFCGLPSGQTSFSSRAHLIPRMLGNSLFYSSYECDSCNHFFGTELESDLANFLGLSRSLSLSSSGIKPPSFKSYDANLKAEPIEFYNQPAIKIKQSDIGKANLIFTSSTEGGEIKYTKNPYRPLSVYKSLLKIGLSIMDEHEIKDYGPAIRFLFEKHQSLNGIIVSGYQLPPTVYITPHAFLFKKRSHQQDVFSHILVFYCVNYIFCIPLVLNVNDIVFYRKKISFPFYPPALLSHFYIDSMEINEFYFDASSIEYIKDDVESLIFQPAEGKMENLALFDPSTNTYQKGSLNPEEIVQIIIGKPGSDIYLNEQFTNI